MSRVAWHASLCLLRASGVLSHPWDASPHVSSTCPCGQYHPPQESLQQTARVRVEGHLVICWSFSAQPNGLFILYLHPQGPCTLRAAGLFFQFVHILGNYPWKQRRRQQQHKLPPDQSAPAFLLSPTKAPQEVSRCCKFSATRTNSVDIRFPCAPEMGSS